VLRFAQWEGLHAVIDVSESDVHAANNWHHLVHQCGFYELTHTVDDCNGNEGTAKSHIWVVDTFNPEISLKLHQADDDHYYQQTLDLSQATTSFFAKAKSAGTGATIVAGMGLVAFATAMFAVVRRSKRAEYVPL
jgi:hypothetical protein